MARRQINRLTGKNLSTLPAGRYRDGFGLMLHVRKGGSRQWVQRIAIDGRNRDLAIGSYPAVTLKQARAAALRNKGEVQLGTFTATKRCPVFAEIARQYRDRKIGEWREGTLLRFDSDMGRVSKIGGVPVDKLTAADFVEVLTPMSCGSSMRKVQSTLRGIMQLAKGLDLIERNPLDGIAACLPKAKASCNFDAIPYAELPALFDTLSNGRVGALCAAFQAATAVRPTEAREARWSEIEGDVWTIPASRMKAGTEHRVPLNDAARVILDKARALSDSPYVFPNARGNVISRTPPLDALAKATEGKGTLHGLRTSFATWAQEQTDFAPELIDHCLAHKVGSQVTRAYQRSDLIEKRAEVMERWGEYLIH